MARVIARSPQKTAAVWLEILVSNYTLFSLTGIPSHCAILNAHHEVECDTMIPGNDANNGEEA